MLRFEDLRVRDQQALDRDFFNRRFRLIAESLGQISDEVGSISTDTDRLVALGLNRVNEVLGPLLAKLQIASEVGFLVAESATPVTVSLNLETTFQIKEEFRELFSPTPYLILQREAAGTLNDYAAIELQSYNRANGGLAGKIVFLNGNVGAASYSDWVISCAAGMSINVMQSLLDVTGSLGTLTDVAADAQAAITTINSLIAAGTVISVNGQTGTVILTMSDISGLVTALASKADSNHGHAIAQISDLQSTLDAIKDGGTY